MCSIFGVLDIKTDVDEMRKKALELSRLMRHRGPDWSGIYTSNKVILAHEHLSIIGINAGFQPLYNKKKTHTLIVNGEIYNHHTLRKEYNRYTFQTSSDCEVILALYQDKGPLFLDELQGMFAFILYDSEKTSYLIGRDHIGIIPLYVGYDKYDNFYVASEIKALVPVCHTIKEFPAGSYLWSQDAKIRQYYQRDWFEYESVKNNITDRVSLRKALEESVRSHLISDVPYGVLLSGGLDSSIISAIVKKFVTYRYIEDRSKSEVWWPHLRSFSVGLKNSPDLKAAKEVADYLGTAHHEVHFTVQEGLDSIRDVIYHTETYDITTIRASIPMYLLSRRIKSMGIKMVLSGEGSDEIFGGYLYFHRAPDAKELHKETVRKLQTLHMFDCIRANKAMSAWGVEARVPFLDKKFLDIAMRINPRDKMCGNGKMEKHILRECFASYLPSNISWRQKEQFSDGVGYSWINMLKSVAEKQISEKQMAAATCRFPYNTPTSKEAYLYREIFEELFPLPSAAELVPGGPSIACSSNKAIEWDNTFKTMNDPSGRAVFIHRSAY